MARYKKNNDGSIYYDANDDGPDQGTPEEVNAFKESQKPKDPPIVNYAAGVNQDNGEYHLENPTPTWQTQNGAAGGGGGNSVASAWNSQPATPSYAFMEGVDSGKMNDSTHNSPKYVAARILASGGSIQQAAASIGATVVDATRMRLPSGEVVDTRRDTEGANQLQWLVLGPEGAADAPATANPAAVGGGSRSFVSEPGLRQQTFDDGNFGLFGADKGTSPQENELVNYLMTKAMSKPTIDRNDPNVRAQSDANAANTDRARRDYLGDIAEKVGPYGTGAYQGQSRMTAERAGQANASFETQAMVSELTAQRQEIAQALSAATGILSQDKQIALQQKLAQIDRDLAYAQLNQNDSHFNMDDIFRRLALGQSAYEFDQNDEYRRSPLAS